ncbi:unnamed protein product [Cochlearia groenlandica]
MRSSYLLSLFLIISILLLSQTLKISCRNHNKIIPLGRELVEHEERQNHHHDHLRVFMKKDDDKKKKKKKKKDKSSAPRSLAQFSFISTIISSFVLLLAAF